MSLFDFPRVHVWGTHVVNVGTGNNDSASPGAELTVTSDSERVRAVTRGMTDAEFAKWVTGLDQYGMLRCQWNYYGDMSIRFVDVRVRSVQLDYDHLVTDPADEPLLGGQVYLTSAVMCDANPEGYHSTQIFAESLEVRAPRALHGTFISRKPERATTRWLNWYRNVSYHGSFGLPPTGADGQISSGGAGGASATFQCAVAVYRRDLRHAPHEGEESQEVLHKLLARHESPAACALVRALHDERARGLVFRYNLYLCYPALSDTELAKQFARGLQTENPAYGLVLGTIAPWYQDEPATISMGRYLKPAAPFANPYRPDKPYYLSPCVARLDPRARRVSIDTANCLPEDGPEGHKYSLGTVTLGVRQATAPGQDPSKNAAPVTTVGALQNDKATYINQGGICDVPHDHLPPEQQALLDDDDYELVLQTDACGVLLYEPEYMIASDCACNYLDELPPGKSWDDADVRKELADEPFLALRGEVSLFLLRRGKVPEGTTPVAAEQWRITPTGFPNEYGVYRYPILLGTETIPVAGYRSLFRLRPADGPGLRLYRLVPQGVWPPTIAPATLANLEFQEYLVEVRVLPYDDYSAVTREQLTWDLIYEEIFRYYALILPAMSKRLDMHDPAIWRTPTAARYVMRMIDRRLWGYYNYMPRTRDLSKYRRELLWRFCRKVLEDQNVPPGLLGPELKPSAVK
jgi:hypothetical protein